MLEGLHSLTQDNKPLINLLITPLLVCYVLYNLIPTFCYKVNQITPRYPDRDSLEHPLMVHIVETCRLEMVEDIP